MPQKASVDKRRETIRRQLYGKEVFSSKNNPPSSSTKVYEFRSENTPSQSSLELAETNYLKKDLLKILFLTLAAVVFQISLFFASQNGLVHLRLP